MKFLFFDIETMRGETINSRIVSFGFLLTDENFNVLDEKDLIMNPLEKESVKDSQEWKKKASQSQKDFKDYYQEIKQLLCDKDTIVVGHGTPSDVNYLCDECSRFHKSFFEFDFLDTVSLANRLLGKETSKKLKELHTFLCGDCTFQPHRSLDDAKMTKEVFVKLFNLANCKGINLLKKCNFENSLQVIHKENYLKASKDEDTFTCNFDIPIIAFRLKYSYEKDGQRDTRKTTLYYDYATDTIYYDRHPAKGSDIKNSFLTIEDCRCAKHRGIEILNKYFDECKSIIGKENYFCKDGEQLLDYKITQTAYSVTSYQLDTKYVDEKIEFDFNVIIPNHWFKNALSRSDKNIYNLKEKLKKVHTLETARKSINILAKMQYGYKDKNFPSVIPNECEFNNKTDRLVLPREYVEVLKDKETIEEENSCLKNGDKKYIPTNMSLINNFFKEKLDLPVLIERTK